NFSQSAFSVTEGGTVTFTVLRTGNLAGTATVNLSATAGAEQLTGPTAGLLTFPANIASRTFTVTTGANAVVDGSRSATLTLSSPASATVTIGDNEVGGTLQFSAATYSVGEGNTSTITVVRGPGGAGGVLVDFATADGSARNPANYTPVAGTLTFLAGNTSQTFPVSTINDTVITGDNTVLLTLSNPRSNADFVGPNANLPVL